MVYFSQVDPTTAPFLGWKGERETKWRNRDVKKEGGKIEEWVIGRRKVDIETVYWKEKENEFESDVIE